MAAVNGFEYTYVLKIPPSLRSKLCKILKPLPNGLKFQELFDKFCEKYSSKLDVSWSKDNDLILEVYQLQGRSKKKVENSNINCTEEEKTTLKECLKKVDFTDVINKRIGTSYSSESSDEVKNYLEIELDYSVPYPYAEQESNSHIVNFFDRWSWKVNDILIAFVTNIYDPSKLWIRFAPVDTFQEHLWKFYDKHRQELSIKCSDVSIGLNCVVLISNLYYRGRIVRTDIQDETSFKVFLYDFGMVSKVKVSQIFYLSENFIKVPAFAVRCMLTNISSLDNEMWSATVVDKFQELIRDKPLLVQIAHIHTNRKILEIDMFDASMRSKGKIPSINYRLVCGKLAKIAWHPPENVKRSQFIPLRKFLYLYPTFEMIENGISPSQVSCTEQLKSCVSWDVLFPEFYRYDDQE